LNQQEIFPLFFAIIDVWNFKAGTRRTVFLRVNDRKLLLLKA